MPFTIRSFGSESPKLLDDAQRGAVHFPLILLRVRKAGGGQQLLQVGGRRGVAVDSLVAPRGVQVQIAAAQEPAVVEVLEMRRDRLAVPLVVLQEADGRSAARCRCQGAELARPAAVRDRVRPVPGAAEAQADAVDGIAVRVVHELQKGFSGVLPDRHGDVLRVVPHGRSEAVGELIQGEPTGEHHVVAPEGEALRGSKPGRSVRHDSHPEDGLLKASAFSRRSAKWGPPRHQREPAGAGPWSQLQIHGQGPRRPQGSEPGSVPGDEVFERVERPVHELPVSCAIEL